ncbi:Patatin-like phospholipase [Teratosphaeria destructans]|uniref:Patatin-like phospholipase n=1 Tax=Teratosphaeria destructans TaxID=418781 RepID=A0A9W7SRQ0_9PEZI|nr:Patatin-like phospholipase [Teratosphaeria destructans]
MDENIRIRRKDTTKGPPLRILSLDGGGVRGFSMLIILQELMHRTFVEIEGRAPKRHEIPKPCDHFDLIAGTGTGGLIAIMLGRLRLDLDTCKDVYVRMTRRVFETDKTFAGIPLKSTMFKASKLEEAIQECVREHTVFDDEGNDTLANAIPMSPDVGGATAGVPSRSMSQSSRYSQLGLSPAARTRGPGLGSIRWGNRDTLLYDTRENRTKTAVTAVLKGTSTTTMLRSYDSRKETAPDVDCTIWQAGRATSATALAFKPIKIVLDEAVANEWPGREVGVFVSIGTGKRPAGTNHKQHEWWEGFLGGSMGEFAEARRRLISKMEGCEDTHQYMLREYLSKRQVNGENYFRFNVEVGVGEFGMNEWNRLSDISTSTRTYLSKRETETMNHGAAQKLAKIHFAKLRHFQAGSRQQNGEAAGRSSWQNPWDRPLPTVPPPSNPMAVELPGDDSYMQTLQFRPVASYEHRPSIADQKYTVVTMGDDGFAQAGSSPQSPHQIVNPYSTQQASPQSPYLAHHNSTTSEHSNPGHSPRPSGEHHVRPSPPPLPPKTPLPYPDHSGTPTSPHFPSDSGGAPRTFMNMGDLGRRLPYPDVEGPPPAVNRENKPSLA